MAKAETEETAVCSSRQVNAGVSAKEIFQIQNRFPHTNKFQSYFERIYNDACAQQANFMPDVYEDPYNIQALLNKINGENLNTNVPVPQSDFTAQDLVWFDRQIADNSDNFKKALNSLIDSHSLKQIQTEKIFCSLVQNQNNEYNDTEYQETFSNIKENGLDANFIKLLNSKFEFHTSLTPYIQYFDISLLDLNDLGYNVQNWLQLTAVETVFSSKENIQISRDGNSQLQVQLGQQIEKRIFEERQVLNKIAIQFLQEEMRSDSGNIVIDQSRFAQEYLKAKFSLNQSLDNNLTKELCRSDLK